MGMFDDVVLPEPIPCPSCTKPLQHFQSKDGECVMAELAPQDVNTFYAICPNCERWVEFRRKRRYPERYWREDFELVPGAPAPENAQ